MYLCIGALLKIIDIYSNCAYTKLEICQELLSFTENDYNKTDASELINCKMNIKKHERDYIIDFNLQNDRQYNRLHELLEERANFVLRDVLPVCNIGPFIQSIIAIMQSDGKLSNDFGMNPEYTKENVFNSFKEFDVKELLINVLYYCYILKDNKFGKDTVENCLTESFINEQLFAANNIFIRNINGENRYTYRKNYSDNELPHELTPNTTVIGGSSLNILYRDDEFHNIVNTIKSNEAKNVYIYGMGGCGKTSIARMVYSHLKDSYDCCGWINYCGNLKQSMIDSIILDDYSDETMIEFDSQKKWQMIQRTLTDSKQTKLFVIDNVDYIDQIQNPRTDADLISMSTWDNTTIIVTSRISAITGYSAKRILVKNLGNKNNNEKCIELFYHYNDSAFQNRKTNKEIVANLCELAGYNTMVIELLAKGSYYYGEDLEEFYHELLTNNFSCANDTNVSTDHDYTVIKTTEKESYYEIGNETVATQIYKLFNMKTRSELEQLILWDFHCLRENEKVNRKELKDWMGYEPKELDRLHDEGWIKFQDGLFFIHPLVGQSISCSEQNWEMYWHRAETHRKLKKNQSLISIIRNKELFSDKDSFDIKIRKIYFANYLSYEGRFLDPDDLIYLADNARRIGTRELGLKFYKLAYDKLSVSVQENELIPNSLLPENEKKDVFDGDGDLLIRACCGALPFVKLQNNKLVEFSPNEGQIRLLKLFWKCCYFYGYMLSYTAMGMEEAKRYMCFSKIIIQKLQAYYSDEEYANYYGRNLDHLAYVINRSDIFDADIQAIAYTFYTEALECRQRLALEHPQNKEYQRNLAWTMDNIGVFLTDFFSDEDCVIKNYEELYLDPSNFEGCENHPEVEIYQDFLKKNLVDAEGYLREALRIRKLLADLEGTPYSTEVAWTDVNMAKLLMKYDDRLDEAEQYILEALIFYHELDKLYPAQHASSQAKAYKIYGGLLKCKGVLNKAISAYKTALSIYEKLEQDSPGIYATELNLLKMLIRQTINQSKYPTICRLSVSVK